jgi:hypothetical protein
MWAMRLFLLPMLALTVGCATEVYHPTRSEAEQKKDIELCQEHGDLSEPYEPLRARYVAMECLKAKGYKKGRPPAQPSVP